MSNTIDSGIKSTYDELLKIRGVSDKIAAFLIRDILLMNPNIKINEKEYRYAFPVDRWVRKISSKLGCSNKNDDDLKECLIGKCREYHVYPLKFAAGIWYVGANSLEILLEKCLKYIKL